MHFPRLATSFTAIVALSFCTLVHAQTAPADRLLSPILASQRTVINLVHPLASKQYDLGRVSGSQVFHRMVLLLQRSAAQEADLQQLLKDQQDPKSAQYHHWLTPVQFGQRFGPSDDDLAKITGWLTAQGFSVEKPSNGRQFILFTGSSAQVESAFQTQMHRYGISGKTYMANATPASVPSALAPDVRGVASLTTFETHFKPQSYLAAKPNIVIGQDLFMGPADMDAVYDVTPLKQAGIQGQGESIAMIEESDIDPQDVADFRTVTGLPQANLNIVQNGPDPGLLFADGEEFEAVSDAEWAGAMDPDATLNLIVTASTEFNQGIDLSTVYAIDNLVSPITALSYGGCETFDNTYYLDSVYLYQYAYEQAAAEGISSFVSSGDNGGDDCEYLGLSAGYGVNAIGDTPWNVSTGGTEFIMPDPYTYFPPPNGNASGYIPESTWNDYENPYDGRPLAGNGGASINFGKPDWQTGLGVPDDGSRDLPDVSLLSGDNVAYLVCERDAQFDCSQGEGGGVIGTSLASQNWAAIQALVDQKNGLVGGAGNPNPVYYALASGANSPFHDITVGDTKVPDPNGDLVGYAATPGYDLATGLGSVDVNKLAAHWNPWTGSGAATVTLSTGGVSAITHGDDITTNVNVTGSGTTPTGDAVIIAGTQGVWQLTLDNTGSGSVAFGTFDAGTELPGGTYSLKAHYEGDTQYAPADSNTIALTVNPEATATWTSSNVTSVPYGTPITLSAFAVGLNSIATMGVSPSQGSPVPGVYTFSAGSTTLGTASIAATGEGYAYATPGTTANLTLGGSTSLPSGRYTISAASPPAGASFLASTMATGVPVTVSMGAVLVSITPSYTTVPAPNSTVNVLVSVINPTPALEGLAVSGAVPVSGAAIVYDSNTGTFFGPVSLAATPDAGGAFDATVPVTLTSAGVHSLVAIYSGDVNNTANQSGAVNVTVGKASTSTVMMLPPSFGLAGNAIAFTAQITGDSNVAPPTGMVTFTDAGANNGAGAPIGTAPVGMNGAATLSVKTLAAGVHFITATYSGDANFSGSASFSVATQIGDFTLSSSANAATVLAGQASVPITLTYAGSADFKQELASSPTGSGVLLSCSGLPAGANCAFTPSAIGPSDNPNGTTSGTASLVITTVGPTLQLSSSHGPRNPSGSPAPFELAGLLAIGLPLIFRRRRSFSALLGLALLAVVFTFSGCTQNTGEFNELNPGTPAGTSNVTVTATINGGAYGTLSHTATISLTVNVDGNAY